MAVEFLVTVDCDLRDEEIAARGKPVKALLDVFEEQHLAGRITWFLNENDSAITRDHTDFLREAIGRGDTLGVHDHIDFLDGRWEYDAILDTCARSKQALESWCRAHGGPDRMRIHRFGCLFQREVSYRVLADLGYTVLSDVYPGMTFPNHTNHLSFNNCSIPEGISPYRHDPWNFGDYRSREGIFLHIPVYHMFLANLDFARLDRWVAAAERRGEATPLALWLFHPYELYGGGYEEGWTKHVAPEKVALLTSHLQRIRDQHDVTFINMETCAARFGA